MMIGLEFTRYWVTTYVGPSFFVEPVSVLAFFDKANGSEFRVD